MQEPVVANSGSSSDEPTDMDNWLRDLALTDTSAAHNPAAAVGGALRAELKSRESAVTVDRMRVFESRLIEGLEAEGLMTPVRTWRRRLPDWLRIWPEPGLVYGHEHKLKARWPLFVALAAVAITLLAAVLFWRRF
jgi:hypothetical protein